jgi:hypothetical protein
MPSPCERPETKRGSTSPTLQEEQIDQEIRDLEIIHQQVQRKKEKMAWLADLQKKIDEADEKCVILLKMTRTEGLNTESFVKRAHSTKMSGTMTSTMLTLPLMMLLLWRKNYRLSHGHNTIATPVARVWWAFGPKAILNELWGNNILIWR